MNKELVLNSEFICLGVNDIQQHFNSEEVLLADIFDNSSVFYSESVRYFALHNKDMIKKKGLKFGLKSDSRVFIVNDVDSLNLFVSNYIKKDEMFGITYVIDFDKLKIDYDCLFLDQKWFKNFSFTNTDILKYSSVFNIYKPHTLLVLNHNCVSYAFCFEPSYRTIEEFMKSNNKVVTPSVDDIISIKENTCLED